MTTQTVDLLDLDRWAREGPPDDFFAAKRREAPVWLHPGRDGGRGFWVVSGHAEVTALGRCPHVLSSDQDNGGVAGLGDGDELQAVMDRSFAGLGDTAEAADAKMLLSIDPPEHTGNRKVLNRGFTPAAIAGLEPAVGELAAQLIDPHLDGETFDFTTEIAMPLPMQVIGDLLGAPRASHRDLLRWSNEAVAGTDPEYNSEGGTQLTAALQLSQLFFELRASRTDHPADDLVSRLLAGSVDGEPLSGLRYTMYLLLLVTAGNETTRNAMSHGLWAFADNPEQWQLLRRDPSLIKSAVEEVLRWSSPLLYFRRNAVDAMTVGGAEIEAGDIVSLWYVSANRDAAVFDDPERFDITRSPNPHVAFGGGGPHFCLGASLARLEIRILLQTLRERVDRIEVVDRPVRLRSNFLNGIKHLPLQFHR